MNIKLNRMDLTNRRKFTTLKISVSAKAWKTQVKIPHECSRIISFTGKEKIVMNIYQILN
jgi:hypothetical protein